MDISKYDFIEFYNMAGSHFYGDFTDIKSAKVRLNELRNKRELLALNHAVLMYCYCYDGYLPTLRSVKIVTYIKNDWIIQM